MVFKPLQKYDMAHYYLLEYANVHIYARSILNLISIEKEG
jgi:hypothetical protein